MKFFDRKACSSLRFLAIISESRADNPLGLSSRGSIGAHNGPFSALTRGAPVIAIDPSTGEKSGRGWSPGWYPFPVDLEKRRKSRLMYRAAVAD